MPSGGGQYNRVLLGYLILNVVGNVFMAQPSNSSRDVSHLPAYKRVRSIPIVLKNAGGKFGGSPHSVIYNSVTLESSMACKRRVMSSEIKRFRVLWEGITNGWSFI